MAGPSTHNSSPADSACVQRQIQARRALCAAPVLPHSGCRGEGKGAFEKPIPLPVASLDLVVFAAGKADNRPSLQELDGRRWRATMDNNLTACYLLCRATHALLKDASASVVLLSSIHGITAGGPISGPAYAAAKAGVLSLTRYLAREWAPDKIRVNAIAPGAVKTPMVYSRLSEEDLSALKERIPLRKFAEPREIAEAVEYLSLAKSVTGTTIVVSNGEHER